MLPDPKNIAQIDAPVKNASFVEIIKYLYKVTQCLNGEIINLIVWKIYKKQAFRVIKKNIKKIKKSS